MGMAVRKRQTRDHNFGADAILARMMGALGISTQTELSEILGVGKAAISDAKYKNTIPPKWLVVLSRPPHRINPTWLETGIGPQRIGAEPEPEADGGAGSGTGAGPGAGPGAGTVAASPHPAPQPADDAEYGLVPMVKARPAGGGGSLETDGAVEGYYAFRRAWLSRKGNPSTMRLMRVTGDSMRPTLNDEDMVLVDESQKDVLEGKIYVVRIDDDIVVKRLGKKPGSLVLISDNRDLYSPLDVPIHDDANLAIVGRVIWMAREVM